MEQNNNYPLVVDLDGTFLKTELPLELFVCMLKKHPFTLLKILIQKIKTRQSAFLKIEMQKWVNLSLENVPISTEFFKYLKKEKAKGRVLVLCTGSTQSYADKIKDLHKGLFDYAYGSTLGTNLVGQKKAHFLKNKYGAKQFEYAGNALPDLKVAPLTRHFILVNAGFLTKLVAVIKKIKVSQRFNDYTPKFKDVLELILWWALWFFNIIIFSCLFIIETWHTDILSSSRPFWFKWMIAHLAGVTLFYPSFFFVVGFGGTAVHIGRLIFSIEKDRCLIYMDPVYKNTKIRHRKNCFAEGVVKLPLGILLFFVCVGLSVFFGFWTFLDPKAESQDMTSFTIF